MIPLQSFYCSHKTPRCSDKEVESRVQETRQDLVYGQELRNMQKVSLVTSVIGY